MKQAQKRTDLPLIKGARIAIIQSKWYREHTDVMVRYCREVLAEAQAAEPAVHVISGCLELPLAARRVIQRDHEIEAVIAFGIIVKGETFHFEMITSECMRGLGTVMMEEDVPILVEVLPVTDIAQARARCAEDEFNKGIEAAVAAVETIDWRRRNPLSQS